MQISKDKKFQPVYIILESEEEVAAMWDLVQSRAAYALKTGTELTSINEVCSKLHKFFSARKESLLS